MLSLQTLERADGVKRLEEAIEKIKASILEERGVFNLKMAVSGLECEKRALHMSP